MRIATLDLPASKEGRIVFTVGGSGQTFPGPLVKDLERLHTLSESEFGDGAERSRAISRIAEKLRSSDFGVWWRQWIAERTDASVLCVHSEDPRLATLPWSEILLSGDRQNVTTSVVHVCHLEGDAPALLTLPIRMLLAAWTDLTGHVMHGCVRELQEFPGKVDKDRLAVRPLADPKRKQLLEACEQEYAFLQFSPPSLIREAGKLAIPVANLTWTSVQAAAKATDVSPVSIDDLNKVLEKSEHLKMVVLNACYAGLGGCWQIASELGVAAIGWPALVQDDTAADFTFFFYQRLIEGWTPLAAVRAFQQSLATAGAAAVEVPTVWLPSPAWATWSPFGAEAEPGVRAAAPGKEKRAKVAAPRKPVAPPAGVVPVTPAPPPAVLTPSAPIGTLPVQSARLEFRPRPSINPALLFNGLHPIEYISIESAGEQEVHLRIECDTGSHISTFRQTVQLRKGVVPINSTEIHFPALHELIGHHTGRRRVSFTATLSLPDGTELSGQTRTVQWMGAKEWLDQQDTWAFIPAFVNPYDAGVIKVFEHANQVLRTLGDPGDSFIGYGADDRPDYVARQVKAIFQTLRDDAIGLTYISPPGSPVFDAVSKRVCGQVIRTHSEVVDRKLGTCQDLTLLLAACAEYVNIRPLVVLVPGHTYVGYWTSSRAQEQFWKERAERLRTSQYGENWMITDGKELLDLLDRGNLAFVEATYVCERQRTFQIACEDGAGRFRTADKDTFDVAIDIFQARREIQPL